MSTVDVLVRGKNLILLFSKLKKAGVDVLKIRNVSDRERIIRVKYKDYNKVIEILGNIWYNKTIKYNGVIGVLRFLKARIALVVSVIVFTALLFVLDGVMLFTDIKGASAADEKKIGAILSVGGAKPFSLFSAIDKRALERQILADNESIAFVTVNKRGNTLKVFVGYKPNDAEKYDKPRSVVSSFSGVITSVSVLRGRALKKAGDKVLAGETIVEGVIEDGENEYDSYAVATVTIRCEHDFSIVADDTSEIAAKRQCELLRSVINREDAVTEYSFEERGGRIILNIKLTFSVTENGG